MEGLISYCFRNGEGKILSAKNQYISMLPASNMKIISGYAAYRILGSQFTMKTKFICEGNRLLISGDPCPLMGGEDLSKILSDMDVRNLGSIVFDNTVMDHSHFGYGWEIDDMGKCYQSRIVPYAINEGCTDSAENIFSPMMQPDDLHAKCRYSVPDQYYNFSHYIGKILGTNKDPTYEINQVENVDTGYVHQEPLTDILKHIEIHSCNFSIEVLTKYLSYRKGKRKGNWHDSVEIIDKMISTMGINTEGIRIVDGSGLSRHNLLTTSFLSEFIWNVGKRGDYDFIHLLPSPGNGTISGRLTDLGDMNINAKTGSFSYCSSLSGYIGKLDVYFSIFLNNFNLDDGEIASKVDDILRNFVNENL